MIIHLCLWKEPEINNNLKKIYIYVNGKLLMRYEMLKSYNYAIQLLIMSVCFKLLY